MFSIELGPCSSYKALGRLESNHFFLDGVRGKAVTFEPPKGQGREERRITLVCRMRFKLSVLLNAPLWPFSRAFRGHANREFNVNMIKDEIEVCVIAIAEETRCKEGMANSL